MKYDTFIFDFDLTLADATKGIVQCFKNVLTQHNHHIPDDYDIKRTIGLTLTEAFSILANVTDLDVLEQMRNEYVSHADRIMTPNTVFFKNTKPTLQALKKHNAKTGIVTTKFAYRAIQSLKKYSMTDLFDIIIGNEHVTEYKPSPQGLNLAISKLNAEKNKTLYIGDTVVDAKTAENSGVDFAAVLTGMTTRQEFDNFKCRYIFKDLSEFSEVLLNENNNQ